MQNKVIGISNFTIEFYNLFFNIANNLELNGYKVVFLLPNDVLKIVLHNRGYKYIEDISNLGKIDKVIFWETESNKSKKILKTCDINKIKTYFLENGYFPNTLQIDNKGQNKNSSIYNLKYNDIINYKREIISKINKIKIKSLKLNLKEKIKILFSIKTTSKSLIKYFKSKIIGIKRNKILKKGKYKILKKGKYIFIPFQVHDDGQILYNSNIIKKMDDILLFFYKDLINIFPNYKIVIKEHPMDLGRIDYSKLKEKYKDIIWFQGGDIEQIINKSEYLIVVNSSVGLQALEKGKKVLLLGNSFYENNPFIEKINNKKDFREKLLKLKKKKININKINKYISSFKNNIFIKGSYKNIDSDTIKNILNYILK